MSDELQPEPSNFGRLLSEKERVLVRALMKRADGLRVLDDWVERTRVVPMDDGGMGSLRFQSTSNSDRKMGAMAAELTFNDSDGVAVIASLNLDESGAPLELDIWKTDFSPLVLIPDELN